jgi:sarcosine oxidase subunit beta
MSHVKVAVIGAGIVGASCAYHLARRGAAVTVLERAPLPATGSTAKSAAGIRHQFSHPENVRMSRYSAGEFERFERLTGMSAGYRKVGYLFLLNAEQLPDWREQAAMQRGLGARVDLLSLRDLAERYPLVARSGLAGASFGPDDGVVDPNAVTFGFLRAAQALGAGLRLGEEVLTLEPARGRWRLTTSQGRYQAEVIVNAAGAFAGEVARRAGFELPVLPYRRNVYMTGPAQYPHPSPLIIDLTTGVWARSEGERFIVGLSNPDEAPSDAQAVDWAWMEHCLGLATSRFPFLEAAGIDRRRSWAGLYEITPDHLPVLGRMPGAAGFVNACGFSGHGVQHAPATGLIVAEEVVDGAVSSFDIADFRFERFARAARPLERNVV